MPLLLQPRNSCYECRADECDSLKSAWDTRQVALRHLDKHKPGNRIPGQPVSGRTAVVGYPVGQLESLYDPAGRFRFDCENNRFIGIVSKLVWLKDLRCRAFSWLKQEMFLIAVHVDVEFPLLYGECFGEVLGETLTMLVSEEENGGACQPYEVHLPPYRPSPPLHYHLMI